MTSLTKQSLRRAMLAIACLSLAGGEVYAQAEEGVKLPGIVRDFQSSHDDFGLSAVTPGHVAGNIALQIGAQWVPVLAGAGFEVDNQWLSRTSDPIAPHMYMFGFGTAVVPVSSPPVVDTWSYADSYDPALGAYGGGNIGPKPYYNVGAEMPEVIVPNDFPPPIDKWIRDGNGGTSVLNSDVDCKYFRVSNHHTTYIEGDVRVLCRGDFVLADYGRIRLRDGASLTVYALGTVTIRDQCDMGMNATDHRRITFYYLGSDPFSVLNQTNIYASVIAPYADLLVQDRAQFYGTFVGAGVQLVNQSGLHIAGTVGTACGFAVDDVYGTAGLPSSGSITSPSSFGTWFQDSPGKNLAARHDITLLPTGDGFLEFASNAFYPVDGELYGNEGGSHNKNFTYQVGAEFTFRECQGGIIELQGNDDIWVFVGDQLVIDLGGVGANQVQVVEMDRLGMADGDRGNFMVYYAHRSDSVPSFRIRTNLELHHDFRISQIPVWAGQD